VTGGDAQAKAEETFAQAKVLETVSHMVRAALLDPDSAESMARIRVSAQKLKGANIDPHYVRVAGPEDHQKARRLIDYFQAMSNEERSAVNDLKTELRELEHQLRVSRKNLKVSEEKRRDLRAKVKTLQAEVDPAQVREIATLKANVRAVIRERDEITALWHKFNDAEDYPQVVKVSKPRSVAKPKARVEPVANGSLRDMILRALRPAYTTTTKLFEAMGLDPYGYRGELLAQLNALAAEGLVEPSGARSHWRLTPKEQS
jgi:hypothetical protein